MQRTRFTTMDCPIARSLDRVGEWWSILILRDALGGMTRFEEFQKSLEDRAQHADPPADARWSRRACWSSAAIASVRRGTNMSSPQRGRDFRPVLLALLAFGNRHFAPEGASVAIVDAEIRRAGRADSGRSPDRPADRSPPSSSSSRPRRERGDESAEWRRGPHDSRQRRLNRCPRWRPSHERASPERRRPRLGAEAPATAAAPMNARTLLLLNGPIAADAAPARLAERPGHAGAGVDRTDRDLVGLASRNRRADRHGAGLSRAS